MTPPENYRQILQRIEEACRRSQRDPRDVTLLAVSKYRPAKQTRALYDAGLRHFAENRVQEGQKKIPNLPPDITWHLIGRLQTNKAKYLPGMFHWVHSVDRPSVAHALEKAYSKAGEMVNVLLQVNVSGEEQKAGVSPEETEALLLEVQKHSSLHIQGFMTMAPYDAEPEVTRSVFRGLREVAESMRDKSGLELPHLSMGMTNDFEIAIEEGSTIVRVGTALYEGV